METRAPATPPKPTESSPKRFIERAAEARARQRERRRQRGYAIPEATALDAREWSEGRAAAWIQELERLAADATGDDRFRRLYQLLKLTSVNRVRVDLNARVTTQQLPDLSHLTVEQLVALAEGRFDQLGVESLQSHSRAQPALAAPIEATARPIGEPEAVTSDVAADSERTPRR